MLETIAEALRLYWRSICAFATLLFAVFFVGSRIVDTDSAEVTRFVETHGEMVAGMDLLLPQKGRQYPGEARDRQKTLRGVLQRLLSEVPDGMPAPSHGAYFGREGKPRSEPIEIDATRMPTDIQMTLYRYEMPKATGEHEDAVTLFVGRGQKLQAQIPEGQYEILVVTGDKWYGEYFGLYPRGVGRGVGYGFQFGGTTGKIVQERGQIKVRETYRKYRGYGFVFLPYGDGSPGFSEVRVRRIKLK